MWFSMRHQETESLWSQLDWCQLVCRIHSCWGDRLLQLQDSLASILRLSLALHYMSFGMNLAIQLMGQKRKRAATEESKWKAARQNLKHEKLVCSSSHHFHEKLLFYRLTSCWPVFLQTFCCFFSNLKSLFSWLLTKAAERKKETNRSMQQFRFLHII